MNTLNSLDKTPEEAAMEFSHHQIALGFNFEALHPYTNVNGNPIYWRIRLKNKLTGKKIIYPMHIKEDGFYDLTEPQFISPYKPIYRQNDIYNHPQEVIWVTEGEVCADVLANKGLIATTSGGSSSASKADWSLLAKRIVIIWRDFDDAGLKYAENITEILLELGCVVKWIDVNKINVPNGGDCVDWMAEHPDASKYDIETLPLIDLPISNNQSVSLKYPCFEVRTDGVYFCKDVKDSILLCSSLRIKALTRDANGINWGRVLEFKDADNVLRTWTMPMELLSGYGDELAKELLRLGLRISPGSPVRKLLVEYITNSETNERARCVLTTGWYEKCFVLPHKVYGNSDEIVLLQTDNHITTNYCTAGNLMDWQKNIALLCLGNSRLIFAISLAFASALLKIIRAENGGFHLRGESSTGKTTALLVAASVWGGRNYVQNWRATDNGLEGLAAQHNDTLLILDELSQIDPKYAGEVAYMLANGKGKARASKSGSARERLIWRLLFLSSGEISLASHMLDAGKRVKAGQEVRMVDIPVDAGCGIGIFEVLHNYSQGALFSEALKNACDKFHGVAGDEFLQKLVLIDELILITKIQNLQAQFINKLASNTHGQVKRVAQRFSLVAAAGEIASEFGITGWEQGIATNAAIKCFESWLNTREGGVGSHDRELILEQVRHFFQENAARFDVFDNEQVYLNQSIPQRCAGFRKSNGDFFVYPKTFSDEICKGLGSPKDVAKIVEQCGWLIPDAITQSSYSSIWVPTQSKTIRLYHFSSKVIGDSKTK